jgi:hypothetical protein
LPQGADTPHASPPRPSPAPPVQEIKYFKQGVPNQKCYNKIKLDLLITEIKICSVVDPDPKKTFSRIRIRRRIREKIIPDRDPK